MKPKKDADTSESEEVSEVLHTIQNVKIPVTLDFVHSDISIEGCQLSVDDQKGTVVVTHDSGAELAPPGSSDQGINLTAIVDGVKVTARRMRSRNTHLSNGSEALVFDLPTMLLYSQRREVFRAQVDGYMDIPVVIYAANTFEDQDVSPLARGMLTTVSVEGCSVSVASRLADDIVGYKLRTVLLMDVADQPDFPQVFAEVRNSRIDGRTQLTTLGLQFVGNRREDRRALGELSTRIQLMAREKRVLSA